MEVFYRRAKLELADKEHIARDYNAGMAIAAIVAKYRIGRSTLYKVLHEVATASAARAVTSGEKPTTQSTDQSTI